MTAETAATQNLPAARQEKAPIQAGAKLAAIIPRNVDEAWRLSCAIVQAGMVPPSYEERGNTEATRSRVMLGIMKGMEVGLPPITAMSTIAIINNRPCIWGDGAVALVQNSGKLEWMKEYMTGSTMQDDWTAVCEMKRAGQPEVYVRTFSYAQAKQAKLTTKVGPWMAYPARMLQMRARAFCVRDGFADVLSGLSIAEEVQDLPEAPKPVDAGFLDDDGDAPTAQAIEHHHVAADGAAGAEPSLPL